MDNLCGSQHNRGHRKVVLHPWLWKQHPCGPGRVILGFRLERDTDALQLGMGRGRRRGQSEAARVQQTAA